MNRFEPRVERLMAILRDGIGESQDVRTELSLRDDATDDDVARSLVQIVSACAVATAGETEGTKEDVSEETDDPRRSALDGSLLGQLEGKGESAVEALDDTSTLMAILRAGRLNQRRAALRRLTRGVVSRSLRGDELKALANMLDGLRDVDLEYELIHARLGLIGRRAARAEREAWERRIGELETAIAEFWEAAAHEEPLASTASESRAQLLLRFRDVPDLVASHVSALLEGDADQQHALLLSLRHAADPRLVPALKAVLEDGGPMLALDAARALRRIDDPRVRPMLAGAYERSPRDVFRAIVGGALADHGDDRALDYVRGLLEREDDEALLAALEGLESLGTAEDSETVARFLEHANPLVLRRAVRTLARISDGRSLPKLAALARETRSSSLRAEVEEARDAIVARMELRGEEPDVNITQAIAVVEEERPAIGGKRFAAWRSFVIGQLWLAVGARNAGIRRLERAAVLRPGWASPHIAMGLAQASKSHHAQALGAFRRALEADRRRVERNPILIRALARSFIARAEQVEREGRADVARGLVNEALTLDLRWASGPQRFELERRRVALSSRKLGAP